jgi:hypothetical protein
MLLMQETSLLLIMAWENHLHNFTEIKFNFLKWLMEVKGIKSELIIYLLVGCHSVCELDV